MFLKWQLLMSNELCQVTSFLIDAQLQFQNIFLQDAILNISKNINFIIKHKQLQQSLSNSLAANLMKIHQLNLSEADDLSIFDSEQQHHLQQKSLNNQSNLNKKKELKPHDQFQFQQLLQKRTSNVKKQQKKTNNHQPQKQGQKNKQKRARKKVKFQQSSFDQQDILKDQQFLPQLSNQLQESKQSFNDNSQSISKGNNQKSNKKKANKSSQQKQREEQQNLISGQQFKIMDNGSNQFNFKYNRSSQLNLNSYSNKNDLNNKPNQNQVLTKIKSNVSTGFNHPLLYTNSKNPYQGVYEADSDAQYFEEDEESPYEYCNVATMSYQKNQQKQTGQSELQHKIKMEEQNFQQDNDFNINNQQDQNSSSSLKQYQDPNMNKTQGTNQNLIRSQAPKKRGRPRKYPLDPNVKIQPKQVYKSKINNEFAQQNSQNLQMGIKNQVKYQSGYKRKRSAPPPLSYYQIDLIKLLPIFSENSQIFDSKIPPDIDFTLQSDKHGMTTDDQQQDKKGILQFQQVNLSERKQYQRDMAIVFSSLGFGIAIAKQYFGTSITFTQYNYLLKTIILNSFRKLQYMLFAQKIRIRRLSNAYFILIKSYLTDFKNSLGQQRSDTFKKVIRIAYKFSSTEKYPNRDQLISLYEQIFRLARERMTNTDNPVRRKIVQRADFWTEQFQKQACKIYLSCRYQWKNLTLIRSQLLNYHPQISQSALTQLLLRLKFRQLFRRLIGQVVKRRHKLSQQHPNLLQIHKVPKIRKIDDNKIRILIHGVSGQQARVGMLQMHLGAQDNIQLLIEAIIQMNKVRISGAKYDEMTQQDQIQFQQYMPKRGRKRKQLYPLVKRQYGQAELLSQDQNIDRI